MSRGRGPAGPEISLFPFLAVLLCTMGSLLVLLVLFSRSAQHADAAGQAEAARRHEEEIALARDELAWRLGQLRGVRDRTSEELAKARMHLAGIEDDARSMADEIGALERTAAALEEQPGDDDGEPLGDLERRLAEARESLEAARREAADRPPAYAVVPYEGKEGTHRRPLYIECCIDGVYLQPEGVRLGPADFEGPPGPGNPLASGLRAAREHIAAGAAGGSGEPAAQPYPLLLVRPSGVMAYYAAREALQSWGSDFGYQFIDEDWTLAFPPADPALAAAETRAIDEARRRLEWLAQVRPRPRSKPAVQYRAASTRGGVVAAGGPSVLGDQSRWDWTEEQASAATAGRGFRAEGAGDGRGDAVLGRGDGPETSDADTSRADAGGRYRGPSKFYDGSGQAAAAAETARAAADAARFGGGDSEHGAGLPNALTAPGGGGTLGAEALGSSAQPGPAGGTAGLAGGTAGPSGSAESGDEAGGAAGSSVANGTGSARAGGTGSAAASGTTGGGGQGPSLPGMGASQAAAGAGESCAGGECSLAGRRGSNWASLASSERPIPLTRPIRLECAANEFRILGSGGRVMARVPINAGTADAVDPLVREVHATVGSWGMAGEKMYWRPELVLSATPDGTGRRDDLERLLADSGLDTRRAGQSDAVRSLPPVRRAGDPSRPR